MKNILYQELPWEVGNHYYNPSHPAILLYHYCIDHSGARWCMSLRAITRSVCTECSAKIPDNVLAILHAVSL